MTQENSIQIPDSVEDFEKNSLVNQNAEIERLLGDEHTFGSNVWKVEELINSLATKPYSKGAYNQLNTFSLRGKNSEVSSPEGTSHVMQQNRIMLERLYQKYEVDTSKADILGRQKGEYSTRITSHITKLGFSFVEEEILQDGETSLFSVLIVADNQ